MTLSEYNSVVDEFADGIYRFILKSIKNEMIARDIVQETYLKVWNKHEEIDKDKAKTYLFRTAYNCMLDWIKKDKRQIDIETISEIETQQSPFEFDTANIINQALDELPEIQKNVVLLRDYEGYNYAEIATITNLTESQVKVYIFRARQTLKIKLKAIYQLQ